MRSQKTLISLAATVSLVSLGACSEKAADDAAIAKDSAADSTAPGVPIDVAVAPGVAFRFDYSFVLPVKAISTVQQQHAAACARLGTARCRITGIDFNQSDEDNANGQMDFLLAPDFAQRFSAEGTSAVEAASGKLDRAAVNGEDAGTAIALSQSSSAAIEAEVARLEARLKARGLAASERTELARRVEQLRDELRGETQSRQANERAIASTPVTFRYASEGIVGSSGAFGKALAAGWGSANGLLALLLVLAGYALPWALLAGLIVLGWRTLTRRRRAALAEASNT